MLKNTELLGYMKAFTEEQLSDTVFIEKMLKENFGFKLSPKPLKMVFEDHKHYFGGVKIKQYPNEFSNYMVFLYKIMKKKWLSNYLCIGPERGGEFFTIDSYFRRINPKFKKSVCIDISKQILTNGFPEYKAIYDVEYIHANSHNITWKNIPLDVADICFIDGDHTYEGVKKDFMMVKDHCKYIVFHDIRCSFWGVEKFWEEIKVNYHHWEFVDDTLTEVPIGIGMLLIK